MSSTQPSSGLRVHRSNRVEVHATLLAAFLRHRDGPVNPIVPDTVVIGNRGTERWLSHRLAHELKVCANIRFPFPASVVSALQEWATGPVNPGGGWTSEALHWAVVSVLTGLDSTDPTWAPLVHWLRAEPRPDPRVVDRRTLGLAHQIADVFDRLMTYRPGWIHSWEAGTTELLREALPDGVSPWMPALWRRLVAILGPDHGAHRLQRSIETLRSSAPEAPPPFPHLHIFGLGSLPPSWLELLAAAALHIPIDIYLLTPSNQFWADVRRGSADLPSPLIMARDRLATQLERTLPPDAPPAPGRTRPNPTLATFGRIARDFQAVLERLPGGYRDAPHAEAEVFVDPVEDSAAAEGPPGTALQWLQSDILHMRHPADHKAQLTDFERRRLSVSDTSIQLHACYGLTRQLEALRDALLDLFAAQPELRPRDVVVLCPNIQKVAPLVSAVFDPSHSPGAPPRIPTRITDRTVREQNPVAEVILRLLTMGPDRLDAPAVVDFLSLEPVANRFRIGASDMPAITELIRASGARWARDADHRATFGQPSDPLCTWRFGLERLALGVVMEDHPDRLGPDGLIPEDRAAGESFELVGRLLDYVATLSEVLDALVQPRPPAEWVSVLHDVLDRIVAPTTPSGFRIRQVREVIARLADIEPPPDSSTAPRSEPLQLEASALATWLERPLGVDSGPLGQQTGAVTFCSLLPERGVPSKVVCLLGMDDGEFPRTTASLGFDPTSTHPRVGDRDPRDEDRYLLLEALMSARESFLVFWTGHDARTNKHVPPAVPVGELSDILEASFLPPMGWDSVTAHLTVHHSLQAFSARNLTPGGLAPTPPGSNAAPHRLARVRWTFDGRLEAAARQPLTPLTPSRPFWPNALALPSISPDTTVELDDLIRFWLQPVAWLVERELSVWLRDDSTELPGREPLELDNLEDYGLKTHLAEAILAGQSDPTELILPRRSAQGLLPPGTPGKLAVADARGGVDAAAAMLQPFRTPVAPARAEVDLGGAGTLVGTVPEVGPTSFTRLIVGAPEGRKLLHSWLQAVALTASGRPTRAIIAWTGKARQKPGIAAWLPFEGRVDQATAYLQYLVETSRVGRQRPLPFGPRSSWAFVEKKLGRSRNAPRVGDVDRLEALTPEARAEGSKAAAQAWFGGEYQIGELAHPAVVRVFGNSAPILDEQGLVTDAFATMALRLWSPLLAAEQSP